MTTYASPESPSLVFPVGHFVGAFHPEVGAPVEHYSVRIGRLQISFPDEAGLAVWLAAHRPVNSPPRLWTRDDVITTAKDELGVTDPLPVWEEFAELGVIVEVESDPQDAIGFAQAHRVLPLMMGLGNTPEDPLSCGVGLPGMEPVVTVSRLAMDILTWSAVSDDLWSVCEDLAQAGIEAGMREPDELDPTRILLAFLPELQTLLGPGAVCLDEARSLSLE